jgi:hypothetical protein
MTRLSVRRRVRAGLISVLFLSSAALLATSSSAAAQPGGKENSCVTVKGVREQTVKYSTIGASTTDPMRKVGDTAVYYDVIYDQSGAVIGDAVGWVTIVEIRKSDGHLLTDYREAVHLPQGTLTDVGIRQDRTGMIAGKWVNFIATGTSGDFAGKNGYRRWRLLPPLSDPPVASQLAGVEIVLCG